MDWLPPSSSPSLGTSAHDGPAGVPINETVDLRGERRTRRGGSALSVLLLTILAGFSLACNRAPPPAPDAVPSASFAPTPLVDDVERVLEQKVRQVSALANEPVIVESVRESNRRNREISLAQIQELDRAWMQTQGVDAVIRRFMCNPAAQCLRDFQKSNPGFPEIFVSDAKGLNVAETNKTSDYWQADEAWWCIAFNAGRGRAFHGPIEYDGSSHTRSIAVCVPVMDTDGTTAIGVCKAVINLDELSQEL